MNDETLPESTPGNFSFDYVDISNVSEGAIADELARYVFSEAPSRARRIAVAGDVIVSTVRTYLRAISQVTKTEDRRVYSTGFAVLRPVSDAADPRYLAYMLTSKQVMDEIVATSVGVSYPAIQGTALHRIRVPYHSLDRQRAIADYLDQETAAIDVMIGKLDDLAAMLHVRRAAVIDQAFAGLSATSTAAVQMIADVSVGIVIEPAKLYVNDGGVPALRGLNVSPGRILAEDVVNISHEGHAANLKSELRPGDLVTVRTGRVGSTAVVPDEWDGANAIDLVITRPHPGHVPRFLFWLLSSSDSRSQIDAGAVGSVQSHFNVGALKRLRVPVIDESEQLQVSDHLDEVTAKIDAMLAKAAELRDLLLERRAALITDVVTGRKEVA